MSSLRSRLKNVNINPKPIWSGPESLTKDGGITQSLLGRFLACPQRFKALVIDGLKPRDRFNHRLSYGSMFHLCDECNSSGKDWRIDLSTYTEKLLIQYPFDQEDILKWSRLCAIQFPVYLDYWRSQHESPNRKSLLQEEVFHVPYHLPSGCIVYLRGRWDEVELDEEGIWLCESKTKGSVDQQQIERRLKYDLQTVLYLIALREYKKVERLRIPVAENESYPYWENEPIIGVRYNVVRRPLSGGKGTIKQTKNETVDQYYDRLAQYIKDEPETYFFRWEIKVSSEDIQEFEKNTLIPCLERLCWWWDQNSPDGRTDKMSSISLLQSLNFTMPFGVNHVTDQYGSDYDDYVMNGSTIGLVKCDNLFPEL